VVLLSGVGFTIYADQLEVLSLVFSAQDREAPF
jgi:hypothetical protein